MEPTPEISFIIPAYNEELLLPRTLSSLKVALKGKAVDFEIIVVDNNSSDNSAQVALDSGAGKTVFEPVNSISKARNAGAKAALGKLLVFIDADTCIDSALVDELLRETASGKVCGGGARLAFDAELPHLAKFSTWLWNSVAPALGFAAGSFSFCSREAFDAVCGFDEGLYASEDIDLSRRLKSWGRKNGLRFIILRNSALSSARRIDSASVWPLFFKMGLLLLTPWRLRSRKACSLWYDHTNRDVRS